MPRKRRNLKTRYSYHITTRCNNREFKLARRECREVFLYAVKKGLDKVWKNAPGSIKALKRSTNPKRRPQAGAIGVVGYLLGFISQTRCSTTNPKKSKSGFSSPPCQVSENPELTWVVRQFIQANRAVNEVEKDF